MQLRLNENKTVDVKFGVGFVRELDKNHPLEAKGIKLVNGQKMAELVISAGLVEWLINKRS